MIHMRVNFSGRQSTALSACRSPCLPVRRGIKGRLVCFSAAVDSAETKSATETQVDHQPGDVPTASSGSVNRQSRNRSAPGTPSTSFIVRQDAVPGKLAGAFLNSPFVKDENQIKIIRTSCTEAGAVPKVIQALAVANMKLAEQGLDYRLQATCSIKRTYGKSLYQTLDEGFEAATLFVKRIPLSSVPAASPDATIIKLNKATQLSKLGGYLTTLFRVLNADTAVVGAVGYALLLTAFKCIMLARYNLVRGATGNAGTPKEDGEAAGNAPASAAVSVKTMDLAFVPSLEVIAEGADGSRPVTATRLRLLPCEPPSPTSSPDLRLATPAPARRAAPGGDAQGQQRQPRQRKPRQQQVKGGAAAGEAAATGNAASGTVSVEEYNELKGKLDKMMTENQRMMQLMVQYFSKDEAAAAAGQSATSSGESSPPGNASTSSLLQT